MSLLADDPRLAIDRGDVRGLITIARRRFLQGELGVLPVVLGLVIIAVVFQSFNSNFLSLGNLVNLVSQIAAIGTVAVGVVLVLLLGEIDLSVGSVAGVSASVVAVLTAQHQIPGIVAVPAAILSGTLIGAFQGLWITQLRVPAFVVTLAGLLGLLGLQLFILGKEGSLNITDRFVEDIVNATIDVTVSWVLGLVLFVVISLTFLRGRQQRGKGGLRVEPFVVTIIKLVFIAVGIFGTIAVMSSNRSRNVLFPIRGVTMATVVLVAVVVIFDLLIRRTLFGRHLMAVGGNPEAARRAGISVNGIRLAVFTLAGTLAAFGGVVLASRNFSVTQSSGGSDFLLDCIAAAVIGGTSLFGGRGNVWSALLGALVIGAITNGMDLLALQSAYKFMITGGVLLLAVTVDALSRRGRQAAGRV